jgi:hypothetical protein
MKKSTRLIASTLITFLVLASSAMASAASKNFAKAITNDDGSTTLVSPRFSFAGANYKFFADTCSDGSPVNYCKLYGFETTLYVEKTPSEEAQLVEINTTGTTFQSMLTKPSASNSLLDGHYYEVLEITCKPSP